MQRNVGYKLTTNVRFTFPAHNFDLVHSQMLAGGIHSNRWTQYLRDMFRVTRPGGWCQMVELYFNIQSDNGSLTDGQSTEGPRQPLLMLLVETMP